MRCILIIALLSPILSISAAFADPWKDESGHGKHWKHNEWKEWKEDRGETPWWERGKGYWDGHFKHGHRQVYPYQPRTYYYDPAPYGYFEPVAPHEFYYGQQPYEQAPPPSWGY